MSKPGSPTHRTQPGRRTLRPEWLAVLLVAYLGAAWLLYLPVMESGFLSDDWAVIVQNPYVQELSLENLVAILDPYGPPVAYAMNYSPLHLLLHAVEVEYFGDAMVGYHLVNVVLHAVAALLLAMLLASSRLPPAVAASAGLLFLVHPANVEAVALVFQAKTTLSTALAFGALLAIWRHPLAATLLFALALLTKFTAVFALVVAAVMFWVRAGDPQRKLPHPGWLIAWVLVLVAVAIPEFQAFQRAGQGGGERIMPDGLVHLRSVVAFGMRYLAMAATGHGVSAFQNPELASSWGDPWWLAGVAALALLGWRSVLVLLRRQEEAAWWIMAVSAFAPISQVFPFTYTMADRYLYTILPGLLGGALLASRLPARRAEQWLRSRLGERAPDSSLARAAGVAALLGMALSFVPPAQERMRAYRSEASMVVESSRNYPDGIQAWIIRADQRASAGDVPGVVEALEALDQRGYEFFSILGNRVAPVGADPRVRAVLDRMAQRWVERLGAIEDPFPVELMALAQAQIQLGLLADAQESLEWALRIGGPHDSEIRSALRTTRAALGRQERSGSSPSR